ncbi:MAG: class I SAM-dependent methyltransferase [Desulfohalobiaceae bacterium]
MGCGTGRQCRELLQQGVGCIGLDRSPAMLRTAHSRNPGSLPLVQAQAWSAPFSDSSFEAVILSLALHEVRPDQRRAVLGEAARLLQLGGLAFILDFEPPTSLSRRLLHCPIAVIERLAGKEHYQASRHFLRHGGTTGLISSWPGSLLSSRPLLQGALALHILQKGSTQA